MPPLVLVSRAIGGRVKESTRSWHRSFDAFSSATSQGLRAIALTRVQAAEAAERSRHAAVHVGSSGMGAAWLGSQRLHARQRRGRRGRRDRDPGRRRSCIGNGAITLGDLASFFAVLGLLRGQVNSALIAMPAVISGGDSLSRLDAILTASRR